MITPAVTVAVLGTGTMGAPIARNLLRAGFNVQVWNRTISKAAVVGVDAHRASTPGEAAAGADVLITMLADGSAVEQVMTRSPAPTSGSLRITCAVPPRSAISRRSDRTALSLPEESGIAAALSRW